MSSSIPSSSAPPAGVFERLDEVISQDELRAIFERYQKVAGYHVQQVGRTL